MYCYKCGCELNKTDHCPNCGTDVRTYKKIIYTSNYLYNDGLQKAQVRDLSGAILALKNSLWYNKNNLDARNLLGLVYYEIGETVAALSEWVISKNINDDRLHRKQNPGADYLAQVQASKQTMENLDNSIARYNHALECCYSGNLDVAVIQLKKVLQINPHYLRARQLLALLYIENRQYKRALRELQRCQKLDINNTTTLRYLQEVNAQLLPENPGSGAGGTGSRGVQHTVRTVHTAGTGGAGSSSGQSSGRSTSQGSAGSARSSRAKQKKPKVGSVIRYTDENETIIQPVNARNPGIDGYGIPAWIYGGIIGALIGAAVVAFVVMPARVQSVRETFQTQIRDISSASDSKDSEITDLETQVSTLNSELSNLQAQAEEETADAETEAKNDSLMTAAAYYIEDSVNLDNACTAFAEIAPDTATENMSDAFVMLYNDLYPLLRLQILQNYADAGMAAYEQDAPDYETAVTDLELANLYEDAADYGQTYPQRQYYLANSYWQLYQAASDKDAAAEYIVKAREVIAHEAESFPSSEYTALCNELLAQLPEISVSEDSEDDAAVDAASTDGNDDTAGTDENADSNSAAAGAGGNNGDALVQEDQNQE